MHVKIEQNKLCRSELSFLMLFILVRCIYGLFKITDIYSEKPIWVHRSKKIAPLFCEFFFWIHESVLLLAMFEFYMDLCLNIKD